MAYSESFPTAPRKVVILRPGALGDVLAVRGVIRFIREAFPDACVTLIAPGERGRLFERNGWADRVFNWDAAIFGWLFSQGEVAPPDRLQEIFAGCDAVLSFADTVEEGNPVFRRRLAFLTPGALRQFSLSRPDDDVGMAIGEWLADGVRRLFSDAGYLDENAMPEVAMCCQSRLEVCNGSCEEKLLVMHPGSGSRSKNWPLENFAQLATMLLSWRGENDRPLFSRLIVTAGEADGELGSRLAGLVHGAELWPQGGLEPLAALLSCARLYVGNDSGVSHLASAVRCVDGSAPVSVVVFGPSVARVWAPPGAAVLEAGEKMQNLTPADAISRIEAIFKR